MRWQCVLKGQQSLGAPRSFGRAVLTLFQSAWVFPTLPRAEALGYYLWPLCGEGNALTEARPFAIQLEQSLRQFRQLLSRTEESAAH